MLAGIRRADLASDQCQDVAVMVCAVLERHVWLCCDCPGICCGNGVCDAEETCNALVIAVPVAVPVAWPMRHRDVRIQP